MSGIFSRYNFGDKELKNHREMALMTQRRTNVDGSPTKMMAIY